MFLVEGLGPPRHSFNSLFTVACQQGLNFGISKEWCQSAACKRGPESSGDSPALLLIQSLVDCLACNSIWRACLQTIHISKVFLASGWLAETSAMKLKYFKVRSRSANRLVWFLYWKQKVLDYAFITSVYNIKRDICHY